MQSTVFKSLDLPGQRKLSFAGETFQIERSPINFQNYTFLISVHTFNWMFKFKSKGNLTIHSFLERISWFVAYKCKRTHVYKKHFRWQACFRGKAKILINPSLGFGLIFMVKVRYEDSFLINHFYNLISHVMFDVDFIFSPQLILQTLVWILVIVHRKPNSNCDIISTFFTTFISM